MPSALETLSSLVLGCPRNRHLHMHETVKGIFQTVSLNSTTLDGYLYILYTWFPPPKQLFYIAEREINKTLYCGLVICRNIWNLLNMS